MVSDDAKAEIEEYLGIVPSFMEAVSEPAADHSWGIVRDLELGETELSGREKALVGLGVAAALQCPYCTHFHKEHARLEEVSEEELDEATNMGATVRYFSTILHGAETDLDEFVDETAEIVDHIEEQAAASAD